MIREIKFFAADCIPSVVSKEWIIWKEKSEAKHE